MNESELIDRLAALRPPEAGLARARAVAAVPVRLEVARPAPATGRRALAATIAVSAVAVLLSFSLLTAPGHAVTSWVGERLGFGQPGGPPSLQALYEEAMRGTDAGGQPAYVLLRGPGPGKGHYDLVTYRFPPRPGAEFPANGARCFNIEFPEARNIFNAGCGLPPASGGILFGGVGGNAAPGMSYQFASGRVSDDVASVQVKLNGRPLPVQLQPIPADLIERFAIRRPFKFFIAFLDDQASGKITVTARDTTGRTTRIYSPAQWPVPGQNHPEPSR